MVRGGRESLWKQRAGVAGPRRALAGAGAVCVLAAVLAAGAAVFAGSGQNLTIAAYGSEAEGEAFSGLAAAAEHADADGAGEDAAPLEVSPDAALAGEVAGEEQPPSVVVHVGGAVVEPGVYEFGQGDRVSDAVARAGGFSGDAAVDAVNLARVLADGEQVIIPTQEQVDTNAVAFFSDVASPGAATGAGKVNINIASVEELDGLPGIGPSIASRIVRERQDNGPFSTVDDLRRVSGIGDKKLAEIADLVCV